ncbi:MAG: hypothetical protein CL596_09390 [Alteromonas sp.]|nr:hypothetical protein [Alteromonas sp.]MAY21267.1 hypothetical protein [Flavobacteriaceae bacterium]
MESLSNPRTFSLSGIVCSTFGHNYVITRKVTNHINEYRCRHCGKEMTDNFSGSLELLTHKIKEVNSSLASFHNKKHKRSIAS